MEESLHSRIRALCAQGDQLLQQKRFEEAFPFYRDALGLVPEPVEQWEATTWILAAIGDLYFAAELFDKSVTAFEDAVRCPGGLGNPFIHLRIGQCQFELGHMQIAADELIRAFMGGGPEIFKNQNPKYLNHIAQNVRADPNKSGPGC